MKPALPILENCAKAFSQARFSLWIGIALLNEIKEKELWKDHFESMNDYIENGCQIDRGQASRLLSAYNHFKSVDPAQLLEINPEKLYLASKLPGSLEKQLASAQTLSKRELQQTLQDDDECHHKNTISVYKCLDCFKIVN